jgi:hypothetical protein
MGTYHRTGITVTAHKDAVDFIANIFASLGIKQAVTSIKGPFFGEGGAWTGGSGGIEPITFTQDPDEIQFQEPVGIVYKPPSNYVGWDRMGITVKTLHPVIGTLHVEDYIIAITVVDTNGWHL